MQPGTYAFRVRRGDSERLSIFLKRKEVFTHQVGLVPLDGAVVHWSADLPAPDGTIEKTTALGGGLDYDPNTGEVSWSLPPALSSKFKGATPFKVWVAFTDGTVSTWLVGTITGEG